MTAVATIKPHLSAIKAPDEMRALPACFDLHLGDCLATLQTLPENSVDSVVTDPPYGLSFMGKRWDYDVPSVEVWAECLRVLKPGGYLLAFAGTRTQHRMAVRIEDAGFEIRDMIAWVYGSGFPKSMDVSKAIDKMGGVSTPPGFAEWLRSEREAAGLTAKELCERGKFYKNVNHGGLVSNWEAGLGFPDAAQFNLLCDLLGLPFERREETKREILGWRTVAPGVAFSSEGPSELPITAPATNAARQWQGWGTALKPALEPITVARKPLVGTVAENVLAHGTGGLNIDGCRVPGWKPQVTQGINSNASSFNVAKERRISGDSNEGRWPANLIHDGSDEVVAGFPQAKGQQGALTGAEPSDKTSNTFGAFAGRTPAMPRGDAGSAARFFYCAKASKADRNEGCEHITAKQYSHDGRETPIDNAYQRNNSVAANNHPTVKPTDLMAYLCRLVTPPGGVVLDPFMGSGSTGKAAMREGFRFIGCELSPEYMEIARARIANALWGDLA